MDILITIGEKIGESAVAAVARQVGYLIFFGRNVKNLKSQADELKKAKERVQHDINEASWNAQEIENDVNDWLNKVDVAVAEAEVIYGDKGKGSCLHLWQRHQISRKASKMTQEMAEIQTKGKFDRVGYRDAPQALRIAESVKDYKALESRTNTIKEIMETLKDSSIHTIGVWGTGGVGKTTLAKEVQRQSKEKNLFDAVVMTTITDNPSVERVQKEIADYLGLTFNVSSEEGRADLLKRRIKKEKSILVIVDDIWEGFELGPFGIPLGDEHKGCKLLLTSRNLDFLTSKMEIQKGFQLDLLKENEALSLFEKMAGDVVKDRQDIATEIVKRCEGLPILIVPLAKALRNKDVYAWKDALTKLESFDKQGVHQKLHSAVELSYNNLESEEKSLFLLIALQGRYYLYKYDLLIFSVGLSIFEGVKTLEDARNRLHTLTNELKDKSLLIEDAKRWVAIHDVFRKAAVSLATKDKTVFSLKVYSELEEWPGWDDLQKCKQIFLPWCYMPPLPEKLESPELEVLALENPGSYMPMTDSFFEETRNLKVLDICGMDCTPKPPTSLVFLQKLTALYLYQCNLEDIAMVGELTNLKILSLSKSYIQELPREIGKLHQLRLLDMDACYYLKVIPRDVLSNLTSLEEFYVGNGFVSWEVEVEGKKNASLNELGELKHHLTSIDLPVPDANVWPVDLFFEKLERFRIFIGDAWSWGGVYESKTLKLKLNRSIQSERGIKTMLKHVDDLSLDELNGVKDVLYDLHGGGFPLLNHLTVQNNGEIETIAASSGRPLHAFPNLETLSLYNLSNLEHISHGSLTQDSFCKLKIIKVQECHKLKCLFISSMSKAFSSLVEIEVSKCSLLETLVLSEEAEFSELHSLMIEGLPALISFSSSEAKQINGGDNLSSFLVPLFNEKGSFPKLETMIISQIVGLTTIWNQQVNTNSFCKLKSIEIKYCEKLVTIFPASIVINLHELEILTISNCNSLEVIFELQEPSDKISSTEKSLQLKSLSIVQLPKLKQIWNNTNVHGTFNFENLEKVNVEDCPMLSYVFPVSVAKHLKQMKDLTIQNSPTTDLYGLKGGS
ncbi:hypothetical protein L6164_000742 [Bauhinia variegata]|uniref:Uncharacterized protein n=1 Tax=Bauhinia variegata TaxID=167791 RepID=A0ACB9Q9I0_BAUVA|nr:hypothetical protein L6164_000742 [Bauhinia variegata]